MRSLQISTWLTAGLLCFGAVTSASDASRFRSIIDEQKTRKQALYNDQEKLEPGAGSSFRYLNNHTEKYRVTSLPDVNFDIGELYGGSVPIDDSNPNRTLFFMFKPSTGPPSKDLTIWLNGGPGCSSLVGFFQENGPMLWQPGLFAPQPNPFAWSGLTNMLWVEQPVGTGFSQGKVNTKGEVEAAKDFVGFFKNFEIIFGIENYKIYVTGESYAGRYVPYISAQMLDAKDKKYFDLSGAITYDPCIGSWELVGHNIPAYDFARANAALIGLNSSFLSDFQAMNARCGYDTFVDKYLTFPPPGNQPESNHIQKCDTWQTYRRAAAEVNPCFDVYHITNYCPDLSDAVGGPYAPLEKTRYFNRVDVKKAIHAPLDVQWFECVDEDVFVDGDHSPDPIQGVLPQVIEATNRVIVGNGDWDGLLFTNGTLLSVQNMTWNGKLGLQSGDFSPLFVEQGAPFINQATTPQGTVGSYREERGLLFVTTYQSGHMQPEFQPRATLKHLQWMLGMITTEQLGPPS